MNRIFGLVLQLLGAVIIIWLTLVVGSFIFVAAQGFFGTSGNEAGGELLTFMAILVVGVALGLGLIKWGGRLVMGSNSDR